MALKKVENKSSKKTASLKEQVKKNMSVTKGTSNNQEVLKEGVPNDHSNKHFSNEKTIGASLGITKNMGDYQSLRVDAWCTDTLQEGETAEQGYYRLLGLLDKIVNETVSSYG